MDYCDKSTITKDCYSSAIVLKHVFPSNSADSVGLLQDSFDYCEIIVGFCRITARHFCLGTQLVNNNKTN